MSTTEVSLATQNTIIKDHKTREPSKQVRIEDSFTKEWCKNEIFVVWDKELQLEVLAPPWYYLNIDHKQATFSSGRVVPSGTKVKNWCWEVLDLENFQNKRTYGPCF